jgi:ribosomal protein S27AE
MFYRVEGHGSDYSKYQSPFSLVSLSDGNYTITYFSVDRLNNTEAIKSISASVDNTTPVTTCSPPAGTYSQFIAVSLSATDTGSGANGTFYKIGQGTWIKYTGEFNITSPGQHNISFYSMDHLGNTEQAQSVEYTISAEWDPWILVVVVLSVVVLIMVAVVLAARGRARSSAKTTAQSSKTTALRACPTCGHVTTYVAQYKRWYCSRCRRFVD